ncbi:Rib/alpha-like domain-containing protein [Corynebacterium jeddahense]|uniref:Long Rib domain-containing protein n=1 Tax=Corynebacterium jeddahense TaxID=1414719 RepID=A0ABY7UJ18_9CORY|nr:Rib/alpha-like domain-containing protein [Corynebacterium jeddahense]WCZ37709.1 hypothetical protein CJEDD_00365 [Corynebacterium jeddahense]
MRTRMACAAVAATLTLATVAPAQAAEYQPTSVLPGFTGTLDAPLPRGEAWFEATSNPDWAMVGPDGTIRLAPGEDVTPGTYEWPVQATFQDNHTETYPVRVTVGQEQTADASQEGAVIDAFVQYAPEVTKQCSATALGVGLPLLVLLPLGFASQLSLPFVAKQSELNLQVANLPFLPPLNIDVHLRDLNSQKVDMGIAGALTVAGLAGAGAIISQCS